MRNIFQRFINLFELDLVRARAQAHICLPSIARLHHEISDHVNASVQLKKKNTNNINKYPYGFLKWTKMLKACQIHSIRKSVEFWGVFFAVVIIIVIGVVAKVRELKKIISVSSNRYAGTNATVFFCAKFLLCYIFMYLLNVQF